MGEVGDVAAAQALGVAAEATDQRLGGYHPDPTRTPATRTQPVPVHGYDGPHFDT